VFIYAGDFGTWAQYYQKGEVPEEISKTHATVTNVFAEFLSPSVGEDIYRYNREIVEGFGLKANTPISINAVDTFDPYERPELFGATSIDIDGEKIFFVWLPGTPLYCTNDPLWQTFLVEAAKKAVDLGADIIDIDGWPGTLQTLFDPFHKGCFCEDCMAGFRNYLKNKYSAGELVTLGIINVDTFNYRHFINDGYRSKYDEDRRQVPLWFDFYDYQAKSLLSFMEGFIEEVKSHARALGKEIYFTVNTFRLYPDSLVTPDTFDYLNPEFDYTPLSQAVAYFKLATSLGKPTLMGHDQQAMEELAARQDTTDLMKIQTVEAYASQGFLWVPYNHWTGSKTYFVDLDELGPYYDFIHKNKHYYENLISTSRIAILYSYATGRWSPKGPYDAFGENFRGICNLLLDAHFQYDVLFAGDADWMEDKLTLGALKRYEVLVLPNTKHLSERQVNLLLSYVHSGGSVIAFGDIGSHSETLDPAERPELQSLLKEGTHSYGQGKFVYMSNEVGHHYFSLNPRSASLRQQFAEALRRTIYPNILTSASENVTLLEYWNSSTKSIVLHLINYSYYFDKEQINSQKNIELEVLLYQPLSGKELIISYRSPEPKGIERLQHEANGVKVKFTIPKLDFYGVVTIGQKGSVIPAINLLLDK
jgi:hypothetical protein